MRIAIVGSPGSGKSTLARQVTERTGWHHVEIDAFHHQPDWTEAEPESLRAAITTELERPAWVCDGNYDELIGDLVRGRADTIVVFDLPRHRVVRQIVWRTLKRAITRQELWNGNREPLTNLYRWDPEENVIRWSWVNHREYQERYRHKIASGAWDHAHVVVLRSHAEGDAWLASLQADKPRK